MPRTPRHSPTPTQREILDHLSRWGYDNWIRVWQHDEWGIQDIELGYSSRGFDTAYSTVSKATFRALCREQWIEQSDQNPLFGHGLVYFRITNRGRVAIGVPPVEEKA